MVMSYQDFINIVPKETKDFVDVVLKLYKHYIIDNQYISIDDKFYIDTEKEKIFSILLLSKYQFDVNDITRVFLESNKLKNIEEIAIINDNYKKWLINEEEIFNKSAAIWCIFHYYENYSYLTPEKIIFDYYEHNCRNDIFYSQIKKLFDNNIDIYSVLRKYEKIVDNYEKSLKKQLEINFYQDLSYELIDYLEKSARVYKTFQMHEITFNDDLIVTTDDRVIASLLVSISLMTNKIALFLNSVGITKEKLEKHFKISYSFNSQFEIPSSYVAILKDCFNKYLVEGKNKNVERKNLSIEKVIGNIFDRNFTNSRVLETILSESNFSIDYFDNFEDRLKDFEKEYLIIKKQKKYQEFYGETSCDVIEFVDFVSKVYTIIKKYYDKEIYNKKYIKNEVDIRALSFFISSYFFDNDYINYFKENGISYEKIVNTLGFNITKKQIEKLDTDIDLIIKQFENIIFGKILDIKKVNINTVLNGVFDINVSESYSIHNIIKSINPTLRISSNLVDAINNYMNNKEEQRKYMLEQKFFRNMQEKTKKFIKRASIFYQKLLNSDDIYQFSQDDLTQLSIYVTAISFYGGAKIEFLKSLFNDIENMLNQLKLYTSHNVYYYIQDINPDIDIIYNHFGKYIFGGKNKEKNKSELTILDIYTNIFGRSFNNSIALSKFLDDVGFKREEFKNFDANESIFIEKLSEQNVKSSIYSLEYINYFKNLSRVYQNLYNLQNNGKLDESINIINATQLLSIYLEESDEISFNNYMLLLKKRGITLESYLSYLNINKEDFEKYQIKKVDYSIIDNNFCNLYHQSFDSIIQILFNKCDNSDNHYLFEDYIKFLNQDPSVIANEMETGEEVLVPMTKDEQINYFNNLPISKLEFNIPAISSFGKELSEHSFIIADEYLKIAEMETGENKVICNIQEELDKLSPKNDIRLFFRRKLSATQKTEQNKNILNNLNKFLQEKEKTLYEQIEHFGYLKKLIAIYIYRLNNYILELENMMKNGEEINFNSNFLENMDTEIIKQILNDKLTDFKKSLIMSTQQYQKINMLLGTHALTLSKVSTYRNTVIPNLYMELSIRDGIISEQESIEALKKINDLLDNMISNNNQLLNQNNFKNENLSNNKVEKISDELSNLVKNILSGEHLIENNKNEDEINCIKLIKKK